MIEDETAETETREDQRIVITQEEIAQKTEITVEATVEEDQNHRDLVMAQMIVQGTETSHETIRKKKGEIVLMMALEREEEEEEVQETNLERNRTQEIRSTKFYCII